MSEIIPAYKGEAMLLRWGDTASSGRTITLQLDEHTASHPFKGFKCGANGQRMQIACVLIDDQEQPLNPDHARRGVAPKPAEKPAVETEAKRSFKDLPRSQQAAIKCQDGAFTAWLLPKMHGQRRDNSDWVHLTDAELKRRLGINSKRELDREGPKAFAFDKLMTDFQYRNLIR